MKEEHKLVQYLAIAQPGMYTMEVKDFNKYMNEIIIKGDQYLVQILVTKPTRIEDHPGD